MESMLKVGRTVGSGVYRAAGALARTSRRILAAIPLLGIAAPSDPEENETTTITGGEEAENGVSSPSEEKSSASSPAENESGAATAVEAKEEEKVEPTVNGSVEEKKEEPTPTAPSPVPVEDKKEEIEKESTEKAVEKKAVAPVVTAPITNGTENGTTEEEEKLAPPTIPKDVPASPKAAIIDDVAVVTKAIEDIEINEKAVAAAVNDAIESANATEIIADACHNNTNE